MIESPDDGDDEEIQAVDILRLQDQTAQQPSQEIAESIEAECLPDFHGELISGTFNKWGSERKRIEVNRKTLLYYYSLNLLIDDLISINVVLKEATLVSSDTGGFR